MLLFRLIFTTRIGLHAHVFFVFPLCLKHSVLVPVSLRPLPLKLKSPLIGQLTHARARTTQHKLKAVRA